MRSIALMRRIPLSLICRVAAHCALAVAAPAQGVGDANGITLQEALDSVLVHGTQLRLGERQVRMGEGALLAAQAAFDPRLTTSLTAERLNDFAAGASAGANSVLTNTIASTIALPKRFRSGIVATPRVDIMHMEVPDVRGALTSRASVAIDVSVPLLRDRGGGVAAAAERAARHSLDAATLDARHTSAAGVLATVVAYWNDLAAEERLDVYRSSELRAGQLVDDTRRLVEADERPAADLQQLLANFALKRAARLAGEQASVEAKEQLVLAMGIRVDALATLPHAITSFPAVLPGDASAVSSDGVWVTRAMRSRADIAAHRAARTAAEVQLRAARDGMRPRLDLTVGIGYKGLTRERGIVGALSSFRRNVPGLDASVQLGYELPLASLAARSETLRGSAAYDEARIREEELVRQVASGVRVARQALQHGREALLASRDAVALSRRAVENEKRKFRLGMSTLFDVILAEDALTSARLSEIAGQLAYAVAIARLRYEAGAILDSGSSVPRVSAETLRREP